MRVELSHPVLSQPADRSQHIWRYMSFAKYVSLLMKEALFFSVVAKLSDGSEGRLPWRNVREYAAELVAGSEYNRNITAVNSWHMREGESWAMWQSYCGVAEGIAIRSTYERLTNCFKSVDRTISNQQVVGIGMVRYLDYDLELLDITNALSSLMCKRKVFEDDREVRAILFPDEFLESILRQNGLSGLYMPVDLGTLIEAVVVAPEAPPWFEELVLSLAGNRFEVTRSSISECRHPDSLREIELVNKVDKKLDELDKEEKPANGEIGHKLLIAALGNCFAFSNDADYLAHRSEERFCRQYIDWRLRNRCKPHRKDSDQAEAGKVDRFPVGSDEEPAAPPAAS